MFFTRYVTFMKPNVMFLIRSEIFYSRYKAFDSFCEVYEAKYYVFDSLCEIFLLRLRY
jgi:hypothetical protein